MLGFIGHNGVQLCTCTTHRGRRKASLLRGFVLSFHLLMNVRAFWFSATLSEAQKGISYDCYKCSSHHLLGHIDFTWVHSHDVDDELYV